jgi:hypothetical protein
MAGDPSEAISISRTASGVTPVRVSGRGLENRSAERIQPQRTQRKPQRNAKVVLLNELGELLRAFRLSKAGLSRFYGTRPERICIERGVFDKPLRDVHNIGRNVVEHRGCWTGRTRKMKRLLIVVIIVFSGVLACKVGNTARTSASLSQEIPKEGKEQPKAEIKLDIDSLDGKWGEVKFNHENHTIRNHTPEGKTNPTCVACHHTDQPKDKLTPPFVKSERDVVLTADVLKDAAAPPVKGCRSCHLQNGDDNERLPVITKNEKKVKVDNELAYHTNCRDCHDKALKARPELAATISGSDPKGCVKCHVLK